MSGNVRAAACYFPLCMCYFSLRWIALFDSVGMSVQALSTVISRGGYRGFLRHDFVEKQHNINHKRRENRWMAHLTESTCSPMTHGRKKGWLIAQYHLTPDPCCAPPPREQTNYVSWVCGAPPLRQYIFGDVQLQYKYKGTYVCWQGNTARQRVDHCVSRKCNSK